MIPELAHPLGYCLKKYGLYAVYLLALVGFFLLFKRYGFKGVLPAVAGLYLLFMLLAFFGQEIIIYFPDRQVSATPKTIGLSYDEAWLTTSDQERIQSWFVPGRDDMPAVLFCHGNASNIATASHLETLRILHSLGLSVLIFDYRGFGQSSGSPTEEGTYRDARAAWNHLVADRGFAAGEIIIWGRSLGGGIASYLAGQKKECRALVLESTFSSIPAMARRLFPFWPLKAGIRHRYPVVEHVRGVACPVLVMHSRQDETVPYGLGRKVYAAAPEPKRFVELRGNHAWGFLLSKPKYAAAVEEFLLKRRSSEVEPESLRR